MEDCGIKADISWEAVEEAVAMITKKDFERFKILALKMENPVPYYDYMISKNAQARLNREDLLFNNNELKFQYLRVKKWRMIA